MIRRDYLDYTGRHPGAADVGFVVEVADASVSYDRVFKKRIYAGANIPYYWLADLVDIRLEVYSGPHDGEYSHTTIYGPNDSVPVILDGVEIGSIPLNGLLS